MQLEWATLLEQAEATLLAMRRSHGEWRGQAGELEAWSSDAHGVAEVAGA